MLSLNETTEEFEVVAEFGVKREVPPVYVVEYQDSEGEWENAVGKWDSYTVPSSYEVQALAVTMAETLFRTFGKPTHVILIPGHLAE